MQRRIRNLTALESHERRDRLAELIILYRHRHNLSQVQLAEKFGVGKQTVIRWEKGIFPKGARVLCKIFEDMLTSD